MLHSKVYISRNMFVLRSNMVLSYVNMRGHSLRLFITHANFNVVTYAFFYQIAMLRNVLEGYVILLLDLCYFNFFISDSIFSPQ